MQWDRYLALTTGYAAYVTFQFARTAYYNNYCNADSITSGINVLGVGIVVICTIVYVPIVMIEHSRTASNMEMTIGYGANFAVGYIMTAFWNEYCFEGVTNRDNFLILGTSIMMIATHAFLVILNPFEESDSLQTPSPGPNVTPRDIKSN